MLEIWLMSEYIHKSHDVSVLLYHFVGSVGQHGNEKSIRNYVKKQGTRNQYKKLLK